MSRQLLTESALLSISGGGLGWWLGKLALREWIDTTWTRYVVLDYSPGLEIFAYWAGITAATTLLFGFIPIIRILRGEINSGLSSGGCGATISRGAESLSTVLEAGQMALAIVLLGGAGVLMRSLWNIVDAEVGP